MTTVYQVGDGRPDGLTIGGSTSEKVSFYGVTPIAQRTGSAQSTFTITIGTSQTSWGFKTSDQFNDFVTQLREIQNTFIALGIWAGS